MDTRPIGHSTSEQAAFIILSRVDLASVLENSAEEVPVYFREFNGLGEYCAEKKLAVKELPGISSSDAMLVSGYFNGCLGLFVDFVWASAASNRYRDAVKAKWELRDPGRTLPSNLHADHIVNRGSLKDLQAAGFDPWVMLFEVPWSANVGFGGRVERGRDQIAITESRINLNGLLLYKLFATDFPKSQDDFHKTLENIGGQINHEGWLKKVKEEMAPYMPGKI
ncbi:MULTISPECIES: hypothetical protein [Stenotrophomonas]|uniref:Uncharacterized protein n=2 Tax=cellular organisms TaxID=131567 RepID=A0ACC2ZTI2_9EURO|nr:MULTISPECIES: hypothetical protein [Stenotrophomonas]KAJ9650836.1 hypothetical protein H2198_009853 [Knufia sp. JES_112]MDH2177499.1 hypothetical protein [Stenotrophomonas sp. GD03654]HDS1083988.1 hypothetical protein [Stenotrophomonas maltophilia]